MTLTLGHGPLSGDPAPGNFTIDGPKHRIFAERSAKRVRIEIAGETVADTTRALQLHETGLLPVYYLPLDDVRGELLTATDHHTSCPFKGEASYFTVTVGDRVERDVAWTYPEPLDEVAVIADHVAFYLDRVGAVYEEAVRLIGHPRDPYHRVDTLRSDRRVRVLHGDEVLAETVRPMAVFETGLPVRWYLPRADVRATLVASDTTAVCPYKGVSAYWSLDGGPTDVAWSYDEPLPEALGLADHVCFLADDLTTQVDVAA
ncbi:DUF427 domain-containing protein [soil metagenome]